MIWLAWRRHRLVMLVALVAMIALAIWMEVIIHGFDVALLTKHRVDGREYSDFQLGIGPFGRGLFSLLNQASAIHALLLCVPCLLGVGLGAPLVARELTDHTNRVAWTQGISRTRWVVTKWWFVGLVPVVLMAALMPLAGRWSHHAIGRFALAATNGGFGRTSPLYFAFTGVVPIAYAAFAFALGVAVGAIVRRTTIAMVGAVVVYALLALVMATTIRPVLAPQVFVSLTNTSSPLGNGGTADQLPWDLGATYRFVPGSHHLADDSSPSVIGERCGQTQDAGSCLSAHDVQLGEAYQPASHYWTLQWRESAIYLTLTALLFGVAVWSVRRWRG